MRFKRTIARVRIAKRKRDIKMAEGEIRKLGLARNKALKEANLAARLADAKEQERQSKLKKLDAEKRLKIAKSKGSKARLKAGASLGKSTAKVIGKTIRGLRKWSQSRGY